VRRLGRASRAEDIFILVRNSCAETVAVEPEDIALGFVSFVFPFDFILDVVVVVMDVVVE